MTVSVVIPSWNSRGYLERCLASLRHDQPALEVVVVDNGSSDGTVAWLRSLEDGPKIVPFTTNRGFAAAVNAGLRAASHPTVLVLNADCEVRPHAVRELHDALLRHPDALGVQPLIVQDVPGPPVVYSLGQRMFRDGRAQEVGVGEMLGDRALVEHEIFGVCGAACLLRRDAALALGGYDERLFAFHEDVDLNVRARLDGWSAWLVPEAVVVHVGNAVWKQSAHRPDAFNARLVARNRLATDLKVLPTRHLPAAFVAELASVALAVANGLGRPVLRGKVEALARAPALLRERRRWLAGSRAERLEPWLGRQSALRRLPRAAGAGHEA